MPASTLAMAGILVVVGVAVFLLAGRSTRPAVSSSVSGVRTSAAVGAGGMSAEATERSTPAPVFSAMDTSRQGVAAYAKGDVSGSLEQFQAAVAADPDNADALNNLAQLLVRTGRPRDAIPYFDRAIQASGTSWAYHFNRARAYAQLAQWPSAIAGYRDAAQLFPDDYITQFNLAKALEANGDIDSAIASFARAIVLAPGQTDFHLSHGRALEAARRPAEAATAYRRYLELEEAAPRAEEIKARIAALERGATAPAVPAP